jgi:FAD/FMN-containing dehydrogenase
VHSDLKTLITGAVIGPDHADYDARRAVFYTGFDSRPGVIVRPASAADVARVVKYAADTGQDLAIRSGGHSVAGHSTNDGGIVLDLSSMRELAVDESTSTAWAETGLTAGEYTRQVGAHGRATGFGDSPSVGIGGITLGGGVGFLHRRYGLTIDSVLAAEVATADGRVVLCDEDTNADLFWAVRGGGGNFGVVTRFRYRLHEVDSVVAGMLVLPATPDTLSAFVGAVDAAPDEMSGMVNVMIAPPMPMFPAEVHGQPIIMALLMHVGSAEAGERAFAPLRAIAAPVVDSVQPMRYPAIYEGPEPPHPVAIEVRSFFMDGVDRSAAERVIAGLRASTAPMRVVQLRVLGGAVARVPAEATPFAHRDRRIMAVVAAAFDAPAAAPEHAAWADSLSADLRQGMPGMYIGFMGNGGQSVQDAYGAAHWNRLREIKARWDPGNLFRRNQNIPPAVPVPAR